MRGLLQRVTTASVSVDGRVVGQIGRGLCAFVGVAREDDEGVADRLAAKIWQLRVFSDEAGNLNRSAADLDLPVLVVSQFTLYADTSRGRRPSFAAAAPAERADALIHHLVSRLQGSGAHVATGRFGTTMQVALINDGPVTVLVEL